MTPPEHTIIAPFEITSWEETAYDAPAEGPPLGRASVVKHWSGPIEGTSTAEVLTAVGETGRGYVASERVDGTLEGRRGTFVIQHGGVGDESGQHAFAFVVPGSGTGDLTGLRGSGAYVHDQAGARLDLRYTV